LGAIKPKGLNRIAKNKTGHHDITEILLKVELNTIILTHKLDNNTSDFRYNTKNTYICVQRAINLIK